jgi:hypothetical protein
MSFEREDRFELLRSLAAAYVDVAIESATREYPHFPYFIATGPETYRLHRDYHPAFYGSFDWHSCVEMHLVAVRLLRLFPDETRSTTVRDTLNGLLTVPNLQSEMAFFATPANKSLERPYGWGWLALLAAELETWDAPDAVRWRDAVAPFAAQLMDALTAWLPRLTYPQRVGMHANTAFSLLNALIYARLHPEREWERAIVEAANRLYSGDEDYPLHYEPSGADFLSPGLCEAVLMLDCMEPEAFQRWFHRFLPGLMRPSPPALTPVIVSDPTDGQIAHLHGLNLSRAWALIRLADGVELPDRDRKHLLEMAHRHALASLPAVTGSDYMVEHWLAVYALILLTA